MRLGRLLSPVADPQQGTCQYFQLLAAHVVEVTGSHDFLAEVHEVLVIVPWDAEAIREGVDTGRRPRSSLLLEDGAGQSISSDARQAY